WRYLHDRPTVSCSLDTNLGIYPHACAYALPTIMALAPSVSFQHTSSAIVGGRNNHFGCSLTIHSSRRRFAARLNSGVRAHMRVFRRISFSVLAVLLLTGCQPRKTGLFSSLDMEKD